MILRFLGTRANTEVATRRHRRHSSLLVTHGGRAILIDCGADWAGAAADHDPAAILVTHAHPDHALGLRDGAPCPVYAAPQAREAMGGFAIADLREIRPGRAIRIAGIAVTAVPVVHSTQAPAVAYRLATQDACLVYAPDVAYVPAPGDALRGVDLYVGDGSTITRSMVRRVRGALVGHASIRAQLGWCRAAGVPRAIFTHCGTEIVAGDERTLGPRVRRLGAERGVDARIAADGLEIRLP